MAGQFLKDWNTSYGMTGMNLDVYSDVVSTVIIFKTYLLLKASNENSHKDMHTTLLIIFIVMALSCFLSLLPRLYSIKNIP